MNQKELLRRLVIDWLDDNYHFGEAETLIDGDDEKSFLQSGVLDSLGFVSLVLYLENRCSIQVDRSELQPENFDGLGRIVRYMLKLPGLEIA